MKRILLIMAAGLVVAGAGSRAAAPTQTVLPVTFKGKYVASAGEVITAAGPLSDVSIRVSVPDVVIHDVSFLNATRDVARPATIDGSGSTNLVIRNVEIRGDGTQQAQAIYAAGGSGLHVIGGECVDPGIEGYTAKAAHGAALHLYSGGSTRRWSIPTSVARRGTSSRGARVTMSPLAYKDNTTRGVECAEKALRSRTVYDPGR